jgi:hypothetical protein
MPIPGGKQLLGGKHRGAQDASGRRRLEAFRRFLRENPLPPRAAPFLAIWEWLARFRLWLQKDEPARREWLGIPEDQEAAPDNQG